MKKIGRMILFLIVAFMLVNFRVSADDMSFEDDWAVDVDIPREVDEYLPFSFDEMDASAIQNAFDFRFFSETGVKIFGRGDS